MPRRSATLPPEHALLRDAIVRAGVELRNNGLIVATEGNLSIRLDGERLLMTPTGRRKWELKPEDLVVVQAAEDAPAGGASSDVRIHRSVYAARPDVTAVAHAHLPHAMGLTLAGEEPDASALPETALFLGRLPYLPYGEPGSAELSGRVAAAFTDTRRSPGDEARGGGHRRGRDAPGNVEAARLGVAVLLERHGAVAIATEAGAAGVAQAVDRLALVEVLCRAWRDALHIRAARAATASSGWA
jgi:ribulose-5-phosphate 4-epimerase/fuculose-1-phosphate aldolase